MVYPRPRSSRNLLCQIHGLSLSRDSRTILHILGTLLQSQLFSISMLPPSSLLRTLIVLLRQLHSQPRILKLLQNQLLSQLRILTTHGKLSQSQLKTLTLLQNQLLRLPRSIQPILGQHSQSLLKTLTLHLSLLQSLFRTNLTIHGQLSLRSTCLKLTNNCQRNLHRLTRPHLLRDLTHPHLLRGLKSRILQLITIITPPILLFIIIPP